MPQHQPGQAASKGKCRSLRINLASRPFSIKIVSCFLILSGVMSFDAHLSKIAQNKKLFALTGKLHQEIENLAIHSAREARLECARC